jgi:hypothetical protein
VRAAVFPVIALIALAAATLPLAGCENSLFGDAVLAGDTVTLTVPSVEGNEPSAVDFGGGQLPSLRRPEQSTDANQWDFQLRLEDGGFVFVPIETLGSFRGAGIRRTNDDFDRATRAPGGSGEYTFATIELEEGATYYVRSREVPSFGCIKYGIMKVLELDEAAGTAELAFRTNTQCGDDRLELDD